MKYIQIPKNIIYDKDISEKRSLVFSYLMAKRTLDDTVGFTINHICEWSNMKVNRQPGKINEKYLQTLSAICNKGYFANAPDFSKASPSQSSTFYSLKFDIDEIDSIRHFGIIYLDELNNIINFKEILKDKKINNERMNSAYLVLVLSYIRVNMNRRTNLPLCCYRIYEKISKDLGISVTYVSRAINTLEALDIIRVQEIPRTRFKDKNGNWAFNTEAKIFADYIHRNSNGDVDYDYSWENEINEQIELLEKRRNI